jgi:RNA polymerase sigma-70 factor (ECF subfamily)
MNVFAMDVQALVATVERAKAGDEIAFARLVATYQLDLVRVAFVVTNDQALAEDAAESVWWIAWRKLPGLRDPTRVRAWLVAVAANEARKLVGQRHRRSLTELRLDPSDQNDDPDREIDSLDLANALQRLRPEDRTLIALRYAADLDSFEIAPLLGLSASGVRARLARLLERLRRDLGNA